MKRKGVSDGKWRVRAKRFNWRRWWVYVWDSEETKCDAIFLLILLIFTYYFSVIKDGEGLSTNSKLKNFYAGFLQKAKEGVQKSPAEMKKLASQVLATTTSPLVVTKEKATAKITST